MTCLRAFAVLGVLLIGGLVGCGDDPDASVPVPPRWDEKTVALAASIPVMDSGRVKPLDTYARFTLLPIAGKRTLTVKREYRLSALEWFLDVAFRPDFADRYRAFLVTDSAVLEPLDIHVDGRKKRDRYSYAELAPAREALRLAYNRISTIDAKNRDRLEAQTFRLADAMFRYEAVQQFRFLLIPPTVSRDERPEWFSPGELMERPEADPGAATHLRTLAAASQAAARGDAAAVHRKLNEFRSGVRALAAARGEGERVDLEVTYYRGNFLFYAQWLYVIAFLAVAVSWLGFTGKKYRAFSLGVVAIPTVLLIVAIVIRCVIRGRPPVSTLYETLLFITAVGCIVAIATELMNRRRIALAIVPILGAAGLFFAGMYEAHDGQDTMPNLVAVLDTNFWLATHVTTVTIGYSAGVLASLIASVFLLGKLVGWRKNDRAFYADISRMVYGVICFGILFSTVGTILGGVWANDSWGRFWGWDPKENGALMIVLAELAMLHGRMGGYLRQFGFSLAAVFNGMIVGFSWWHVNLLGVGLHSYGFQAGLAFATWSFYAFQAVILVLGGIAWQMERRAVKARKGDSVGGSASEYAGAGGES